jgi:hypothetical protein
MILKVRSAASRLPAGSINSLWAYGICILLFNKCLRISTPKLTTCAMQPHPTTITLQDGQRHSLRIAPTKSSRGSLQVVSFVRNERPFRKDYKDQTSIAQDFKRGAKNAQVRGTQALIMQAAN